jgi:dihydrofolate synthase / folylpolyglutamate synthase
MLTITEISEQHITGKIGELSTPSRLGVKTSLDPIQALLDRLGHPERKFPSIHVGGTSGKGSTSTFLANILQDAGYKVGLFTKPHLDSVRERFVINGIPIGPEEIMEQLERIGRAEVEKPTWFELTTAIAFQYFAEAQVDFGVIEVGLGGRYDATNVIDPELSILTNVGLDHTDVLGDTIEKIAADKVGIFKPGKPIACGVVQPSVIEIVKKQSRERHADLRLIGRDFDYSEMALDEGGSRFDFDMGGECLPGLVVSMMGKHQVVNASVAAAAAMSLGKAGVMISTSAIYSGLQRTRLPGRMEIFQNSHNILLDGAHSPPKMEALAEGLRALYTDRERVIGVMSFSQGHNATATLAAILPLLDTVILTEFDVETDYGNKRAQEPAAVAKLVRKLNPSIHVFLEPDPSRALEMARKTAGAKDMICVTGSIFLVGEIRKYLTLSPE